MTTKLPDIEFQQALIALEAEEIDILDKIEMLMQIAMGIQQKPKEPEQIYNAIILYDKAIELCPKDDTLLLARLRARKGTAFQVIPSNDPEYLKSALKEFERALPHIEQFGSAEETAELNLNIGLVIQNLAGFDIAIIQDAIKAYQRALRVFKKEHHPAEFAILHNNLATAYLALPVTSESGKVREALAVQSFQEALTVVTLIDQPSEYAMLQNNLGNALQYVSSEHSVANNLRAIEAYDEALKVRNKYDTPNEYINTICNKANCISNLPDDLTNPENGNEKNLGIAKQYYTEAIELCDLYGDTEKSMMINQALQEIFVTKNENASFKGDDNPFGESRI